KKPSDGSDDDRGIAQGHELLLGVTKQARRASSGFPLATWGGVESLASPEQRGREPLSGTRHKPERLFALAGTPALALRSGTAGRALGGLGQPRAPRRSL